MCVCVSTRANLDPSVNANKYSTLSPSVGMEAASMKNNSFFQKIN